jgi:hypothetical protein
MKCRNSAFNAQVKFQSNSSRSSENLAAVKKRELRKKERQDST